MAELAQLQVMFADVEPSVIGMIYQQCGGSLERTVEALLAMGGDSDATLRSASAPSTSTSGRPSLALRAQTTQAPPALRNELPADFLRLPGMPTTTSRTRRDSLYQEMQDEQLARLMQDELFRAQLVQDPQFRSMINHVPHTSDSDSKRDVDSGDNGSGIGSFLSSMGSGMRSRINYLANRFRREKPGEASGGDDSAGYIELGDTKESDTNPLLQPAPELSASKPLAGGAAIPTSNTGAVGLSSPNDHGYSDGSSGSSGDDGEGMPNISSSFHDGVAAGVEMTSNSSPNTC